MTPAGIDRACAALDAVFHSGMYEYDAAARADGRWPDAGAYLPAGRDNVTGVRLPQKPFQAPQIE